MKDTIISLNAVCHANVIFNRRIESGIGPRSDLGNESSLGILDTVPFFHIDLFPFSIVWLGSLRPSSVITHISPRLFIAMPFSDIFADLLSSLSLTEAHAEAPPAEDKSEEKEEDSGESEDKSEGDEEGENDEGGDDEGGDDGGEDEGEDEAEEEEEEEVEDIKPKLEAGRFMNFLVSESSIWHDYGAQWLPGCEKMAVRTPAYLSII